MNIHSDRANACQRDRIVPRLAVNVDQLDACHRIDAAVRIDRNVDVGGRFGDVDRIADHRASDQNRVGSGTTIDGVGTERNDEDVVSSATVEGGVSAEDIVAILSVEDDPDEGVSRRSGLHHIVALQA